jgi:mxaJ protein
MSLVSSLWAVALSAFVAATPAVPLRVCADPNNLPFSDLEGRGFENKIAALAATYLRRPLSYYWLPQRRGFVRNTLNAAQCDVVIGVPAQYQLLQPTQPYYRSTYTFVTRHDKAPAIETFDDPRLRKLTIGIPMTGSDYNNPPPSQALAIRHLSDNVRGFPVYGDYSKPAPLRDLVDAVADGRVDVAVVWGPIAGYFARQQRVRLDVTPVLPKDNAQNLTFTFDIAMGVRRDDESLRRTLDRFVTEQRTEIRHILAAYGVPLL